MPKKVNREKALKGAEKSENFRKAKALVENKEGLLDTVMTAAGDGLMLVDPELRIVYQNKAAEDFFGERLGESYLELYEDKEVPVQKALKTGEIITGGARGVTKEGEKIRFENVGAVIKDKAGNIVVGLELIRSVEERERAVEELKARTAELEEFSKIAAGREAKLEELRNTLKEQVQERERLKTRLIAKGITP